MRGEEAAWVDVGDSPVPADRERPFPHRAQPRAGLAAGHRGEGG